LVDTIDRIILFCLGVNARISSQYIATHLNNIGYTITDRAVRQRLDRLEKSNTILRYSAILNPGIISEKINRTILLRFKYTNRTEELIRLLVKYVNESDFCIYSSKLNGDFDYICHFIFDSVKQYELESDNFQNRFKGLISDFHSYESKMIKSSPYVIHNDEEFKSKKNQVYDILDSLKKYDTLNDRLQAMTDSMVKYFHAHFARIWFVDKNREWLILKFSSGKYKRIDGKFSKVRLGSLKIGHVASTKEPVVTNDVVNDARIKFPNWAEKEKLRSFAAYPLIYKNKSVAVLAMFSKKKLSHVDFEIMGIFCEQLSKELAGFFEAKEFLSE